MDFFPSQNARLLEYAPLHPKISWDVSHIYMVPCSFCPPITALRGSHAREEWGHHFMLLIFCCQPNIFNKINSFPLYLFCPKMVENIDNFSPGLVFFKWSDLNLGYICSLVTLPLFSPIIPSPLPSGYCQFVLNFNVSGYILLACSFC